MKRVSAWSCPKAFMFFDTAFDIHTSADIEPVDATLIQLQDHMEIDSCCIILLSLFPVQTAQGLEGQHTFLEQQRYIRI